MTLQEAIKARHSVRQYVDKPIEAEKIAQLQALIDESNRKVGLHMQLVTNEPKAFAEVRQVQRYQQLYRDGVQER